MVDVEGKHLLDVTHESSMSDACASECFLAYEGDYIASDYSILSLDWDGRCAWVY